jgi:hypothetical protein
MLGPAFGDLQVSGHEAVFIAVSAGGYGCPDEVFPVADAAALEVGGVADFVVGEALGAF